MTRRYWFFFFVVSGFCSLLYEVVWLRLAMASFGVTTPLASIVLSTFMGGLALGSWGAGVLASRLASGPAALGLRLYAAAEGTTALLATLVPVLLRWGRGVLAGLGGAGWGSGGYYAGSAGFVVLALLPSCICMGATFPLGLFVLRRAEGDRTGEGFSYLYLANVIGAALGTVTTAFVLVELLGFSMTLALAATANATIAMVALGLAFRRDAAQARLPDLGPSAPARPADPDPGASPARLPVLSALLVTGLASMGMEVVWIRQLTPYLGNFVYCFAVILFLYLVSTVMGASLYRAWLRRRGGLSEGVPAWAWAAIAVASLLPLVATDPRFDLGPFFRHGVDYVVGRGLLRPVLAIVPFALGLGAVTPMLVDGWSGGDPGRAGTAYGFNVVGCVLGPLLGGFVLLPRLGERGALVALALPLLAGALLPPLGAPRAGRGRGRPGLALLGAALVVPLLLLTHGYETTYAQGSVIRRDETATVVATGKGKGRLILVNGIGMTYPTPITKMMVHLPMAFHEKPPRSALVICFGMGTSFRSALSWGVDTTSVELIPSVPGLFSYFFADGEVLLRSPRAHVVIDDGRRFLERSSELFDVIVIDPPPPLEAAGASLLYSREFYESARRRLPPDGILQQWLPRGGPTVSSAFLKAVVASFPHVRIFKSIEGWGLHVLASGEPIASATPEGLAARLPPEAVGDLLEWGPGKTAEAQFAVVLGREIAPAEIIALDPGAPMLVDDRPLNEYFILRRELRTRR